MGILQRLYQWWAEDQGAARQPQSLRSSSLSFDDWVRLVSGSSTFPLRQTLTGTSESVSPTFSGYAQAAYGGNGIVFACIQARLSLFSEARFQYQRMTDGRPGELFGKAELAMLEEPWTGGTTGDLLARMLVSADLGGNAFVVRSGDGLRVLRPDWVTMVLGSDGAPAKRPEDVDAELMGIIHTPGGPQSGNEPDVYTRKEFAHFAPIPDPLAKFRGMSWLTPIVREIQGDSGYTSHKLRFLENGATPNMVVVFPETVNTPTAFDQWVDAYQAKESKGTLAGKTMYMAGGTTATPVGANMQGMDFKAVQGAGETRIAAASGVPAVVLGISEGLAGSSLNAGNYTSSRRRFADLTMRPLWRNAAGSLAILMPRIPGARLWYDARDISFLQEDVKDAADIQSAEALTIRQLVDAGFKPDDVVDAVTAGDLKRLAGKHSGLYSVQLQAPGTVASSPTPDDPARSLALAVLARGDQREQVVIHNHQPPVTFEAGDVHVTPGAITVENRVEPSPVAVENHTTVAPTPVTVENHTTIEPTPVTVENRVDVAPANVSVTTPDTLHIASMPARETRRKVTKRTDKGGIAEAIDIEQDAEA